jgi:hypothetical protein
VKRALPLLLVFLALAAASRADEIRLKDGTKIVGTIVGFEDSSFKVQTSYGYALVRKDKIAAIVPSEPKPEPKKEAAAESKKPSAPAAVAETPLVSAPASKNEVQPAMARAEQPPTPSPAKAPAPKKEAPPPAKPEVARAAAQPGPSASNPPGAKQDVPPRAEKSASAAAAPVARVPETPPPPPIPDEVRGNLYINHTYGFRMYKPPSWEILEDAQTALPSAIVAMGTGDETTLLVIGRERMKDPLEAHAAATERQLRQIYENYRRLSEHHTRIAGLPALARRYRGTLAGHDWSGVVLSFARGGDVFTILGMTYADSDLIQIQENVIAKTIASLEFVPQ